MGVLVFSWFFTSWFFTGFQRWFFFFAWFSPGGLHNSIIDMNDLPNWPEPPPLARSSVHITMASLE